MRHITIQECYESITISSEINDKSINEKEAEELESYIAIKDLERDNVVWGRNTITFINYVGYIRLSTVDIEILPKISINNNDNELGRKALLNMLSKSGKIKVKFSDISSLNLYKMNLNEILSYLFAYKLQRELVKGPYKEYVYVEENSSVLKGSLLVKQQIINISSCVPKAYCRYEEFSMDNSLNQILNYCVKILLKEVGNRETIKLLRYAESCFVDITQGEINDFEIASYKFNRLNSRFNEVFILAKMIIKGYSALGNSGASKAFSILFKMNEVFERYITNLLNRSFEVGIIHPQHFKYKLLVNEDTDKGIFKLIPDIVIEQNGIEELIIDIKWKNISSSYNRHGVKREDLYQMYAYLTRYPNVKKVILLYPENENVDYKGKSYLESWYLDNNESKKIRVYTVNLESEENTINSLEKILSEIPDDV